jgi:hypothetical protein
MHALVPPQHAQSFGAYTFPDHAAPSTVTSLASNVCPSSCSPGGTTHSAQQTQRFDVSKTFAQQFKAQSPTARGRRRDLKHPSSIPSQRANPRASFVVVIPRLALRSPPRDHVNRRRLSSSFP